MKTKKKRGKGRPKIPVKEKLVPRWAYLKPEYVKRIEEIGDGSFPFGLRSLVERFFSLNWD